MNKKPDLSFVRKFGRKAFVHIPKTLQKGKLLPRSTEGILMGSASGNGYRIFIPSENKIITSRDVKFIEEKSDISITSKMENNNSEISTDQNLYFEDNNVTQGEENQCENNNTTINFDLSLIHI